MRFGANYVLGSGVRIVATAVSFVGVYIICPDYSALPKQPFYLADPSLGDHRRTEP